MKVSPVDAAGTPGKGHAYGLVRQLQEGTFNGASIEKHTARFADRLVQQTEPVEEPEEIDTLVLSAVEEEADTAGVDIPTVSVFQNPVAPQDGPLFGGVGTYLDLIG